MKGRTGILLAASAAALGAALGDTPLATSADCTFALDSTGAARAVKTAAEFAALPQVAYRAGDTVAVIAPDGNSTIFTRTSDSTEVLPISAGGQWTFVNAPQGTATFTVRHSVFNALGDGTAASPAKLVDGDELIDYSAGVGYVFTLDGGETLPGALRLPAGFRLESAGNGAWRIVPSSDGCLCEWAQLTWAVDGRQAGPDRTTNRRDALPIAYTGDNWARATAAASALTLVSPSGATTTHTLTGTGAQSFTLAEKGDWTVTLTMEDGGTLTSTLTVNEASVTFFIK